MADTIILAGATGDLGGRIARALAARGAAVRAPVRPGTQAARLDTLRTAGVEPVEVAFDDAAGLRRLCQGAACVVSALNGLEDTVVTAQGQLLDAAVAAGVPRFVPSDYSIDYRPLPPGSNRNFDLRRRFAERVDAAPVRATSIFNGAFADLLDQAPVVFPRLRRVVYWNDPDLPLDFTTKDDVAAFTAAAALDPAAPRALHIAGARTSARGLAALMSELTGHRFTLLRAGSTARLVSLTGLVRRVAPQPGAVFPVWQGMQYLHSMFSGLAGTPPLDNDRYPGMHWTGARDVLAKTT